MLVKNIMLPLIVSVACNELVYASEVDELVIMHVLNVTSQYAHSISCETSVNPDLVAALVPWRDDLDDRSTVAYAVIWHGDIGCNGGTGSTIPQIAIVRIGAGLTFIVEAALSSPQIKFDVPVRYIKELDINAVSASEMVLEGMSYGADDANCCPSMPVRFTVRRDQDGNWKTIQKRVIGALDSNY